MKDITKLIDALTPEGHYLIDNGDNVSLIKYATEGADAEVVVNTTAPEKMFRFLLADYVIALIEDWESE